MLRYWLFATGQEKIFFINQAAHTTLSKPHMTHRTNEATSYSQYKRCKRLHAPPLPQDVCLPAPIYTHYVGQKQ